MLWLLMSHGAQQRHLRNNPTLACSDGVSYQIPYKLAANPGLWEHPSCTRPRTFTVRQDTSVNSACPRDDETLKGSALSSQHLPKAFQVLRF